VGKNKQNGGHQQGAIHHEPGQHGDKTRAKQAEIAHTSLKPSDDAGSPTFDAKKINAHNDTGRDRLFEDREQHDEAEKNSEKTRHSRDVERHRHTNHDELSERNRASSSKRKS
jgi:hypothetical protein